MEHKPSRSICVNLFFKSHSLRYFIHFNYNGRNYKGWQRQPNDISVQEEIENALSKVFQSPMQITGCGRTDSGVHAKSFYAHFDTDKDLPKNLSLRLNKLLPKDIGIFDFKRVNDVANCRFDAISRTYKYFIHFNKDAFLQEQSFWLHTYKIDIKKMNKAASVLLDFEDFTTFEKKGSDNKTSLCDVSFAQWEKLNDNQWCFTITANRFLRNMVRRIVGTLLMIGVGRLTIDEMNTALNKHDILEVNIAPPAHGLFLWNVKYPSNLFIE